MKKIIISIILLLVLDLHFVYCQESPIDSTLISVEHATINGEFYTLTYRTNDTLAIFDSKNNVVFNKKYDYASIAFVDFDQDGHKDVVLDHISAGNGSLSLILFDSTLRIFRPIENFNEYLRPKKIQNTNYYFSYSKAGCADYVWYSDLFKIENYQLINLALIYGDGCPPKKRIVKTRIDIYKIYYVDKKELSEKLPYKKYIRNANKWKFIKRYWFKNFKYFD